MYQSENIAELATALSVAQGQISHAIKDSVNPHFKSNYADLASVWDAIRKPLTDNNLCIIQTTEGNNLITTLAHKSGQWIKSVTPIFNGRNDAQGFGSGLTYARRYALAGIAGVAQDDDDANDAQPPKQPKPQQKAPAPTPQNEEQAFKARVQALLQRAVKAQISDEEVTSIVGKSAYNATKEQLNHLLDVVTKKEGK